MPTAGFSTLYRRVADLFGEEALNEEISQSLGETTPLARLFQERGLQNGERILRQAQKFLATLTTRRAKLLERVTGGADWEDMEEIRERLGEYADECSDSLQEMGETFVALLENQRTELEEKHQATLGHTEQWLRFERWIDEKLERVQELSEEIIEQFDEEAATISQA
ncbi:MAG: hypothetical protein GXY76_09890 [Chloroflexi bacterium]|nr:hypothetical protein [Chloroflexota bacterium]